MRSTRKASPRPRKIAKKKAKKVRRPKRIMRHSKEG
jgi:hypothetical protein